MSDVYTSGYWMPNEGEEDAFIAAWTDFAGWIAGQEGAGAPMLARDLFNEGAFVSMARWSDIEAVHAWKASDEFKERMAHVQKHVKRFSPSELEVVVDLQAASA